ncbi:alpha/beta fold hydrolase [Microvirga subterranea]|uniref:Esterase/lipase superfamily enzyme n=1 Tax=Microvirga subterranea TaxID=186651 RepID=A0A370HH54_9HYPH|nr:alpha/beta fold hydrolase [Microvirga subterranea]RDI57245.1 esterase/lipase superfamily enzyme [Microvirga subterranea]
MAQVVTVYFATNRMPLTDASGGSIIDFGPDPGPIDGTAVRFGSAQARVTPTGSTFVAGSLYVASEQLYGPGMHRGSRDIFEKLRQDMKEGGRPTLVVIHGFSNTFKEAIERAAAIISFYGLDANVFSFTWPSIGTPLPTPLPYSDYFHDRGTARGSGVAIARTMRILYDFIDGLPRRDVCRQPLHLICHSMGNYAFRYAVQALMQVPQGEPREYVRAVDAPAMESEEHSFPALVALPTEAPDPNRLRRTFDQIVLAAADEDEDAFEDAKELRYLPRLGNRVSVYHTREDWILSTLSSVTKFNGPRLGVNGPENMALISDKVTAVDVSDAIAPTEDFQSHQYYRISPAVRDDIVAVLSGERQDKIGNRDRTDTQRYSLKGPVRGSARRSRKG